MRINRQDSFWTSYSDLMTSLFFVMLVLFIVCLVRVSNINAGLNSKLEQYESILKLEQQFKILAKSTSLEYDPEKRMFYAKDFVGIEIFNPFTGTNLKDATIIKKEYLSTVDKVGKDLQSILKQLYTENKNFKYLLVIEGTAAIPWQEKYSKTYNPDSHTMYDLSYRRALALYDEWKNLNLRQYNTEIIISGSGFNGVNRDNINEDNNKRFVIQIIPKIDRPTKYDIKKK